MRTIQALTATLMALFFVACGSVPKSEPRADRKPDSSGQQMREDIRGVAKKYGFKLVAMDCPLSGNPDDHWEISYMYSRPKGKLYRITNQSFTSSKNNGVADGVRLTEMFSCEDVDLKL